VVSDVDLLKNNLFSPDRRKTALTLVLETEVDPNIVIRGVEKLIADYQESFSLYQVGMPLVSQALAQYTQKDFFRLPPITFLLIAMILIVLFRRITFLLIPLVCVGLALIWTLGLMALVRIPLSMLTMIVPVFLIAVGTAYCFHIIAEYQKSLQQAAAPVQASRETFAAVSLPTFLAVITTIIGLGSLLVNHIPTIREFALFACFGMFSLMVITLGFLPALLALIPLSKNKKERPVGATHIFDGFIDKIIDLNLHRQKITLPILFLLAAVCAAGMFRIRVETNPIGYFKEDIPVKRHFHEIYQDLSGSFPINVVMEGSQADYFEDPAHLAEIERLQSFLEKLDGVDKTISFADYLKLVNYSLNGFNAENYRLPEEGFEARMLINSYNSVLGQDMFTRFMSPDLSKANIVLLTHISSSRDFLHVRDAILSFVEDNFAEDLHWNVTGFGISISASSHLLTRGQIKSLSLTLVLVFAIMFALFLSWRVGLIALVPNIFPIIVNFGIMGWLGLELSMATSLIASIAIGLAVDDTIHYLFRYNREFRKDLDDRRALRETLGQVGRPICFTTLTICVGFSVLIFSNFQPTAVFGVMMAITLASALVGDLILLPSLMQHVELVTLWDLVRLKLGQEPAQGIPLFKSLSRTEVQSIIMAGSLKKIESGEVLFRKGDPSDSMYTIISGTMDVIDTVHDENTCSNADSDRWINRMKPGDVLGEMGLLRSAPRSATVVACEPVELLQINWKMIKRLQWLYPPTARKFMYNLLSIMCGHVERLTTCLAESKTVDDATGLVNRENFIRQVDREILRSKRYQEALALCLVEIEFRTSSDYDPKQKEQTLGRIGRTLQSNLRSCDLLGRLEPGRFGILLPETPAEMAVMIAARLERILKREYFALANPGPAVFCSVAAMKADSTETAQKLLARAIERLESARAACHSADV
jgi:diguanylate cyclase (GGDEF)-like protein